jgi:hypothetical protein
MYERLMEEVVREENLAAALKAVKRNQGAPGIDHMKTTEVERHFQAHWLKIRAKLLAGTWVPSPVKRVEIPKPNGGKRKLGIPTVVDRVIQQVWIEKHLRLKVNAAKSGTGRVWERKFLGFRLDRAKRIGIAPESLERFKTKVREMWRGNQSRSSNQLRDDWSRYVRGWWGYYQLAEARGPLFRLEGWIRRHIRKCFWLRWPSATGREYALRRLGVKGRLLQTVRTGRAGWFMAAGQTMQAVLKTVTLRRYGFLMPSDLAAR